MLKDLVTYEYVESLGFERVFFPPTYGTPIKVGGGLCYIRHLKDNVFWVIVFNKNDHCSVENDHFSLWTIKKFTNHLAWRNIICYLKNSICYQTCKQLDEVLLRMRVKL
jgi:hypothetical protein